MLFRYIKSKGSTRNGEESQVSNKVKQVNSWATFLIHAKRGKVKNDAGKKATAVKIRPK